MAIKVLKRVVDILFAGSILFLLYLGYFIFFDKPVASAEFVNLYLKIGLRLFRSFCIYITKVCFEKNELNSTPLPPYPPA
ncbi:hypothetical protein V1L65_02750 [Paenibacillus sp. IITD108]